MRLELTVSSEKDEPHLIGWEMITWGRHSKSPLLLLLIRFLGVVENCVDVLVVEVVWWNVDGAVPN